MILGANDPIVLEHKDSVVRRPSVMFTSCHQADSVVFLLELYVPVLSSSVAFGKRHRPGLVRMRMMVQQVCLTEHTGRCGAMLSPQGSLSESIMAWQLSSAAQHDESGKGGATM